MSEEDRQSDGREDASGRKKLSEDTLSIVLIAAAILLGIVYYWDQSSRETLERQMAIAESIHAGFAIDSARCTIGSAGQDGRVLVFACTGVSPSAVAEAASRTDVVTGSVDAFEEVRFRSPESALNCPPTPDDWPGGCMALGGDGERAALHDQTHEEQP